MNYRTQSRAVERLISKDEEAVQELAAKINAAETRAASVETAKLSLQLAQWRSQKLLLEHGLEGLRRKQDAIVDLRVRSFTFSAVGPG